MDEILDYTIAKQINQTPYSIVYSGHLKWSQQVNRHPAIIELFDRKYLSDAKTAQLKQKYNELKHLKIDGVIKIYAVKKHSNGLAVIYEDFSRTSLKDALVSQEFDLTAFLSIAADMSQALGYLHKNNIIHTALKPHNILYCMQTGKVKLKGCDISSLIERTDSNIFNPHTIKDTLAYMSPEQTGRMNRSVDYRTDLYSLGIIFYEMLTGTVPFISDDPLEIIYAHIAKPPVSPVAIRPDIPETIASIILKLLSKSAEERYQNSFGLKLDLENCLNQLKRSGTITPFPLGQKDISIRFHTPQIFIGRKKEIQTLLSIFERVVRGSSEVLLFSGQPGIGKTRVINEVKLSVIAQKGYYVYGKYDPLHRDVPYRAILQAFEKLVQQILSESEERVRIWRQKLLQALGTNGKLIIDVIPDVALIIGEQPDVPALAPEESQNRFNTVFENFTRVFAQPENPLVIFLDDLQWIDDASLNLVYRLLTHPDARHLLFIGSYRNDEISESHPLQEALVIAEKTSIEITHISLSPLTIDEVTNYIIHALRCENNRAYPLAELVHKKTNGNPFFINQFMKTLYEENQLRLDLEKGWQWDIDTLKLLHVTDNVVELLASRITHLADKTQTILKIGACIGSSFDLDTLSGLTQISFETILDALADAAASEIIVNSDNQYVFTHNRIRETVYSLISNQDKKHLHYKIGTLMLDKSTASECRNNIFTIVNHLNIGMTFVTGRNEVKRLIELNLMAGSKAKASAAYFQSMSYLKNGMDLLAPDHWKTQYTLSLALYNGIIESAFLCGEYEEMEAYFSTICKHATALLDTVPAHEIKIQAYIAQNRLLEALHFTIPFITSLGVKIPKRPNLVNAFTALLKAKTALSGITTEDFLQLPEMTDTYKFAALRIITKVTMVTYSAVPPLLPVIASKGILLSLKYGHTPISCFYFAGYGLILCGFIGHIEDGFAFGELALHYLKQSNTKPYRSITLMVVSALIRHWKLHLKNSLDMLLDGYQSGIETGDLESAAINIHVYLTHLFFMGNNLADLEKKMTHYNSIIHKFKQKILFNWTEAYRQLVLNLMGHGETPLRLDGKTFNEDEMIAYFYRTKDRTGIFQIFSAKLMLAYLFESYEDAFKYSTIIRKHMDSTSGTIDGLVMTFYDTLTLLNIYPNASRLKKMQLLHKIKKNQGKLKKWSVSAPENHLHKYRLTQAEHARIKNEHRLAVKYYDQAIMLAKKNDYRQEQALANELAARYYISAGREKMAALYLQNAYDGYRVWGAYAKVSDLEKKYKRYLANVRTAPDNPLTVSNYDADRTSNGAAPF